jgi:rubrerythrin
MAWGALNEITTLRGYEAIEKNTKNPVLAELCRRITKQERRHFAWYFNGARERLQKSRRSQVVTRLILSHVWSPVGAGVKKLSDVSRLYNLVFPERRGEEVAREIDETIGVLPGLAGLPLMARFAQKALPPTGTSLRTVDTRT